MHERSTPLVFWIAALVLFAACFLFFVYLTQGTTFADPDSFYHVKIAEYIIEGRDFRQFDWLPFTVLGDYYTDQHLLYHVYLAPFVALVGPFAGAKLANALLAATCVVAFTWMLRSFHIRYPMLYGVLLAASMPFVFRINLVKAPAFSLLILFLGLAFAWKRKRIAAGCIAFIYVWSYGGFALLPIFVLLMVAMRIIVRWFQESEWLAHKHIAISIKWSAFVRRFFSRKDVHVGLLVLLGTALGVVFNPFFPANLQYLNDQLIQIGVINYQHIIGVGGEWYPYGFGALIANTIVLSIALVPAVALFLMYVKRMSIRSWLLLVLWLFFLAFTLKSRRYVEYYVPFGMAFVATVVSDALGDLNMRALFRHWRKKILSRNVLLAAGLTVYIAVALVAVLSRDVVQTKRDLSGGFRYGIDRNAAEWLAAHTPKDAMVVHSDWDEFPYLFYWNDHNRYIAGLDPTFLYKKDKDIYWAWVNVTIGKTEGADLTHAVIGTLQSGYVLIESGHDVMLNNFMSNDDFVQVYTDADATIFAHKEAPIL